MNTIRKTFNTLPKWTQIMFFALLSIVAMVFFGFIFGYMIMWLWNQLMPQIFDLPTITYWQGIGLFILARILLGSFGSNSSHKSEVKSNKKTTKVSCDPDWDHYNTWWENEGKAAFEQYAHSQKSESDEV